LSNNKVIPFVDPRRSREEIRDQACAWLARLDAGATQADMDRLAGWLAENPRHVRMFFNMASMWDKSLIMSELAEVFPLHDRGKRSGRRTWLAAAALMFVAVLGGGLASWAGFKPWDPWWRFEQVYETAIGERLQVELPDGSEITLNTDTRIEVSFNASVRNLVLERGEGYFNVERDTSRPFRVHVGSQIVEAVGTAFTVHHSAREGIEIIVTEGKVNYLPLATDSSVLPEAGSPATQAVAVVSASQAIPLVAGERATVADGVLELEKTQVPPDELEVRLAWRMGMLVFQGDSLERVIQEVSRYTTIKLEAEESIRDIKVEGLFRAGDIDGLLISMRRNFQIESQEIAEGQILLTASTEEE
jgi:transmembrane sensor